MVFLYPVSEAFLQAVQENTRNYSWSGKIKTKKNVVYEFGAEDIVKGSGYITRQCCGSSEIEIGTVYAAEMEITLFSDIDRYTLEDAKVELFYHLTLADGTVEDVLMGTFEVSEANRHIKTLELKAYDSMLRFEKDFNGFQTVGTAYDFINYCCTACQVELANSEEEINILPNAKETLSIYTENDIETCRDVLAYTAQVLGGFFFINREGKLEFKKYGSDPVMEIHQKHRFSSSFSDFVTRYTAVSSTNKRTQISEYYALETDDGLTMNLGINPLLQFGLDETRETLCRNILADLSVIRYVPFDSDTIGNPALDVGDVLVFSGGQADSQQITCITSIQTRIGGKQSLKCVGKNPRLARAKSKNDKNISGLLNQIEEQGKTGKIGIHTFTNTSAYTIADTKIKVISIEFASSEENHMQFFGQLLVYAEAVQQERSANAIGTIVIPFPSGESENTETVSDKADAGNGKGQTGGQTVDESSGAIADQMKESTGEEINTEPASALSVEVSLPVSWTEDGQAVCHVTFEFNDEEITIHQPVETWHSGWHSLTLYYPIEHIVANYTNTFNVYLHMENGTGTIEPGGIIASVSGQAMAAEEAWDGKLELEDRTAYFGIGGGIRVKGYTEVMKKETMELVQRTYSDRMTDRIQIGAFCRPVKLLRREQ